MKARDSAIDGAFSWTAGKSPGPDQVGRMLSVLGEDGYRILQRVPSAGGHLDHVVVGPSGVFAVETREWKGRFRLTTDGRLLYNGRDAGTLVREASARATDVRSRLRRAGVDTWVYPVVALTRMKLRSGAIQMNHVMFLGAGDLPGYIRSGKMPLTQGQVDRAVAALSPVGAVGPASLHARRPNAKGDHGEGLAETRAPQEQAWGA